MHPYLIYTSFLKIPTYGFMIAMAYVLSLWYATKKAHLFQLEKNTVVDIFFYAIIGGMLGGKILYIITFWNDFGITLSQKLKNIFSFNTLTGGFVFYGGFIAGLISVFSYTKFKKLDFWKVADFLSPSAALAHSIGRIGCFSAGCCHGRPTESIFGVVFSDPYCLVKPEYINVPIHPTQLYESAGNFFIFLILNFVISKKTNNKNGIVFALYLILYSLLRFTVEFFRGDDRGAFYLGLSQAQIFSFFILFSGITLFIKRK